jgi:hypothetical protein
MACVAVSALGVVSLLAINAFPGSALTTGEPIWRFGPVILAGWVLGYAALAIALLRFAEVEQDERLLFGLACCLLLMVIGGGLPMLWARTGVLVHVASKAGAAAGFLIGWVRLMPPSVTGMSRRALLGSREHGRWALLGIGTVLAVIAAEAVFHFCVATEIPESLRATPSLTALMLNALVLLSLVVCGFAVTNRLGVAAVVVYSGYFAIAACNLIKARNMHAAVQPLDYQYIYEFLPMFRMYFTFLTIPLLLLVVGWGVLVCWLWRRPGVRLAWATRLLAFTVAAAIPASLSMASTSPVGNRMLRRLGLQSAPWDSLNSVSANGLLLQIGFDLPLCVTERPENYSESEVNRCVVERHLYDVADTPRPPAGQAVNVILFVVESLMDTDDLGVTFTADPMPNIHANMKLHTSGHAIVPGRFGGSANSEFELLTGMTLSFLPSGSCPYKQYVRKDLPTLPALLRANGYRTAAVFPDPPRIYNRQVAAPHLGFDELVWLGGRNGPKDITGRWQSDDSIVDEVLELSRTGDRPFFIHAFTEATHWPYDQGYYLKSDLDFLTPLEPVVHDEVKTYVNAVRNVDRAVGRLITYFEKSDRKMLIVVLGDHLPPLSSPPPTFRAAVDGGQGQPEIEERSHRVPLLIWSNYGTKEPDVSCGLNFLPTYLLHRMGIKPTGFLALNDSLRSQVNVLSTYVQTADGVRHPRGTIEPAYASLLRDYQLLQYDLLLGEQFSLRPHRSHGRTGD